MARKIQFRRGTAASWTSTDPTLAIGELGLETDTGKIKIGDGVTAWSARPYIDAAALAHIADTSAAHAAASIASTPAGTLAATDVQAALNELDTEKAPLASPALTGTPTAPTAATATNTTQVATTAFVRANRAEQAAADISQYVAGKNLDTATAQQKFTVGNRSLVTTLPAATFRPITTNSRMALDVIPNGVPSEDSTEGFAWIDVCSTDIQDNLDATTCAHVGVKTNAAVFGSRGYGGSSAPNLLFEVGAGASNYATLDSSGTFVTTGSIVVPFIRSAVGQPIIDLRTTGTILLKAAAAADKPCVIRAVASQSGSLLEVQDESNGVHIKISNGHTAKYPELVAGMNALPLGATSGYFHAPSCAGTPTGTPQTHGSSVPIVIDTTGSKLFARIGGTWKSCTLA